MPGRKEEQASLGKVLSFLHEWDRGDKAVRKRVLVTFLSENTGKTFYELEMALAHVASLFLARITTWIRLTYRFSSALGLQLKAIKVFISASSHDQYMAEFLEDGGVLTLFDILTQAHIKGEDKEEALDILLIISNTGRKYKEFICQNKGLNALSECLHTLFPYETQRKACAILQSLSNGNPKHLDLVYQELIALLSHTSPKVQRMVLGTLRPLQSVMATAHATLVEPLLEIFKARQLDTQEEAITFVTELKHSDVRSLLLNRLVSLLQIKGLEFPQSAPKIVTLRKAGSLPVFVQQAAAAKAIRSLAEDDEQICGELLSLGVVHHLLFAMGNVEHSESQIQACLALKSLVRLCPFIQEPVRQAMGSSLLSAFMSNPETMHKHLDEASAESLLSNQATVV